MSVFIHGAVTGSGPAPNVPSAIDDPDHTPKLQRDGFDCPRCGRWAHQTWTPLQRSVPNKGWSSLEDAETEPGRWVNLWQASICARCNAPSIWMGERLVYPPPTAGPAPRADMPDEVKALYVEAAQVAAVSRRAAIALARATVERLLKDPEVGETGANLFERIESLEGDISRRLRTLLHLVRDTANGVLHERTAPSDLVVLLLDDEEGPRYIELFLEAANLLVDERITNPRELDKAVQAAPRVRALLEQQPGTSSFAAT